jgi:endonuclease/exonuclease/phosphatase family metal-dependent hydrolase
MPSYRMTPTLAPERSCPEPSAASWYSPENPSDIGPLEEWCSTVGPEVRTEAPPASFGSLDPGDSLAIVAWNVDAGSADVLEFLRLELGLRCAGSWSELTPGSPHFALLIQEAFRRSSDVPASPPGWAIPRAVDEEDRPGERLDVMEVAERCGLSLAYVAAARNGHEPVEGMREDKGVAIVSTLPLYDVITIELPYEAARRVAVAATLRGTSGDSLRIASVHLISTPPPARILRTGNGSRLRQGLALVDALDQAEASKAGSDLTTDSHPISTVLAGDFNTWSDRETILLRLREHFPDSPQPLGEGTHGAFPTDHILFRGSAAPRSPRMIGASYVRIANRYYSDHHAIRAIVQFGE